MQNEDRQGEARWRREMVRRHRRKNVPKGSKQARSFPQRQSHDEIVHVALGPNAVGNHESVAQNATSTQFSPAFQNFIERLQTAAESNLLAGDAQPGQFEKVAASAQVTLSTVRGKLRQKRSSQQEQLAIESAVADPRVTAAIKDIVDASLRAKAGGRRLSSELDEWAKKRPQMAQVKLAAKTVLRSPRIRTSKLP